MRRTVLLRFLSLIFLCGSVFFCAAQDLDKFLGDSHQVFQEDRVRFITRERAPYFRWTSADRTEARYDAKTGGKLTWLGLPVQEAIFRFQERSLKSVYISIYNRGDSGPVSAARFREILQIADRNIIRKLQFRDKPVSRSGRLAGNTVYARFYPSGEFLYSLKWSSSGRKKDFVPEYVQVEIEKRNPDEDLSRRPVAKADHVLSSKASLADNVKQEDGRVWIDHFPMVDQGQKGYCAAAVAERILRYYGITNVTQHTIAQIAGTSAQKGTSGDRMVKALEDIGSKYHLRVKDVYHFPENYEDAVRFINQCSKLSKKAGKGKIQPVVRNNVLYYDETFMRIDPDIFLKVRQKDTRGCNDFFEDVQKRIRKGLPVVWSVILGLVPEDGVSLQSRGGHMRIIIGFNAETREIIYTDSWGRGHELKSMPVENAWAITTRIIYMDPRVQNGRL